jgi:hypothetical protein
VILDDIRDLPPRTIIVEGGARGADQLAREIAADLGVHCATVPALWRRYGKSAGPRRNAAMALLNPDVVFAYSLGGAGTADMVRRAEAAGIRVIIRQGRKEDVPTTT